MKIICSKCGHSQEYNLKRIKSLREKLKVSQSELARGIGIPQQTISQIERGIGDPSFYEVIKILNFLFTEKQRRAINTDGIHDFDIIADKILNLLRGWGSLPEETIAVHLQQSGWITWAVLKKLKAMKKVKNEHCEWQLYGGV